MIFLFVLIGLPLLISVIDFLGFAIRGKRIVNTWFIRLIEIGAFLLLPYMYISSSDTKNNCCGDSAVFSPEHQITIWAITALCLAAYFYSSYRTLISTPIIEVLINSFLIIGVLLNAFIAIQTKDLFLASFGNLPIILLALLVLAKKQNDFINQSEDVEFRLENKLEIFAWKLLKQKLFIKYPIIFILCLPILVIITTILLLVGQEPDSIVRAFTDTYKHGFSQWDYKCDNVQCDGHYLCSVAAKGHKTIVKPQRFGVRNDGLIVCNRQLLISNAFEELIQEKIPYVHKLIRSNYNKVGNFIHKYYYIFNFKVVSDVIYIVMKPLEWFFLLTLYTFEKKPETRIARQYMSKTHRQQIDRYRAAYNGGFGQVGRTDESSTMCKIRHIFRRTNKARHLNETMNI